jgi:uncharacterized protein (TIGR00369 family)
MRIDSVSSLELQPPAAPVLAPYASFLGLREGEVDGERRYFLDFREEYVGNPLIRTFHGGILASFGEQVAALHLARERGDTVLPECATLTFDYLRPAFAGTLMAIPNIVRAGRRRKAGLCRTLSISRWRAEAMRRRLSGWFSPCS